MSETRQITTHHDSHGLNESIRITAGEPGPGGASHRYEFFVETEHTGQSAGLLQFQLGPRNVDGSTPGLTVNAVLAALIDHLEGFRLAITGVVRTPWL